MGTIYYHFYPTIHTEVVETGELHRADLYHVIRSTVRPKPVLGKELYNLSSSLFLNFVLRWGSFNES